jgi:hypothetical protein
MFSGSPLSPGPGPMAHGPGASPLGAGSRFTFASAGGAASSGGGALRAAAGLGSLRAAAGLGSLRRGGVPAMPAAPPEPPSTPSAAFDVAASQHDEVVAVLRRAVASANTALFRLGKAAGALRSPPGPFASTSGAADAAGGAATRFADAREPPAAPVLPRAVRLVAEEALNAASVAAIVSGHKGPPPAGAAMP